jgi:1-phosphofructokinase family hexose kinase
MILCITPNPNIERTWIIPGFHTGSVFQASEKVVLPSGKGVNVARAVRHLGGEVLCAGLLGGHTGRLLASLLEEMHIPARWTWTERETRTSVAVINPSADGADATLIREAGEPLSPQDWQDFHKDVLAASAGANYACISGSAPAGLPLDGLTRLAEALESRGVPLWVDSSGEALTALVAARPTGVKINRKEAQELAGAPLVDLEAARAAAAVIRGMGIRSVCITLGAEGAVLLHENETWLAQPPEIHLLSSVGSGDAFLAGLLLGFDQGRGPAVALRMATAAGAANALTPGGGRLNPEDYERLLPNIIITRVGTDPET